MRRVRFLEGCYLFDLDKSVNFNDELDIPIKRAEELQKRGIVDILKEKVKKKEKAKEEPKKQTKKKTKKKESKKSTKKGE